MNLNRSNLFVTRCTQGLVIISRYTNCRFIR